MFLELVLEPATHDIDERVAAGREPSVADHPPVPALSDQDVQRAVSDVCLTAARADVDEACVARAIETLFALRGGVALKVSTLVEMSQRRDVTAASVLLYVHQQFPTIHVHETAAQARLDALNAETMTRVAGSTN